MVTSCFLNNQGDIFMEPNHVIILAFEAAERLVNARENGTSADGLIGLHARYQEQLRAAIEYLSHLSSLAQTDTRENTFDKVILQTQSGLIAKIVAIVIKKLPMPHVLSYPSDLEKILTHSILNEVQKSALLQAFKEALSVGLCADPQCAASLLANRHLLKDRQTILNVLADIVLERYSTNFPHDPKLWLSYACTAVRWIDDEQKQQKLVKLVNQYANAYAGPYDRSTVTPNPLLLFARELKDSSLQKNALRLFENYLHRQASIAAALMSRREKLPTCSMTEPDHPYSGVCLAIQDMISRAIEDSNVALLQSARDVFTTHFPVMAKSDFSNAVGFGIDLVANKLRSAGRNQQIGNELAQFKEDAARLLTDCLDNKTGIEYDPSLTDSNAFVIVYKSAKDEPARTRAINAAIHWFKALGDKATDAQVDVLSELAVTVSQQEGQPVIDAYPLSLQLLLHIEIIQLIIERETQFAQQSAHLAHPKRCIQLLEKKAADMCPPLRLKVLRAAVDISTILAGVDPMEAKNCFESIIHLCRSGIEESQIIKDVMDTLLLGIDRVAPLAPQDAANISRFVKSHAAA